MMEAVLSKKIAELIRIIAKESIKGLGRDRLVLGEQGLAIQDALDNGGLFLDMGPEVLQGLVKSNIDPFLVYREALLVEVESRIPRIDFIGANADELLNEWRGRLSDHTPIHIRQMLWLEENMGTFGYERQGNSWVLKSRF